MRALFSFMVLPYGCWIHACGSQSSGAKLERNQIAMARIGSSEKVSLSSGRCNMDSKKRVSCIFFKAEGDASLEFPRLIVSLPSSARDNELYTGIKSEQSSEKALESDYASVEWQIDESWKEQPDKDFHALNSSLKVGVYKFNKDEDGVPIRFTFIGDLVTADVTDTEKLTASDMGQLRSRGRLVSMEGKELEGLWDSTLAIEVIDRQ